MAIVFRRYETQSKHASYRTLVIGGSGRVGGSAVRALTKKGYSVDVAGRNFDTWNEYSNRFNPMLNNAFISIDAQSEEALEQILPRYDLIINTAGPFQRLRRPLALESALKHGKKYIDVCDDIELSRICRSPTYRNLARKTGAAAIISAGIWPGGSSLLAHSLLQQLQKSSESNSAETGPRPVDKIVFSFFTAGSGGAGETILTATFLLLGEDVLTYVDGNQVFKLPASDCRLSEFGTEVGQREVVRLNLIECESCFCTSSVPNVETYFGTAPRFWNTLFIAMARLVPQAALRNRDWMRRLARLSLPMVRLIDYFVGARNGIRVDAYSGEHSVGTALMVHEDMEQAVGDSLAAFSVPMLEGAVAPGVYFPEEVPSDDYRSTVLREISSSSSLYQYSFY